MDLKTFLLARIEEDEELAKDASEPSPNWDMGTEETGDGENIYYVVEPVRPYVRDVWIADLESTGRDGRAHGDHIARHDPTRVLAECAAKRAIIEQHAPYGVRGNACATCADWPNMLYDRPDNVAWPCPTLRALAAVYADHPDYQPEWAASNDAAEQVLAAWAEVTRKAVEFRGGNVDDLKVQWRDPATPTEAHRHRDKS